MRERETRKRVVVNIRIHVTWLDGKCERNLCDTFHPLSFSFSCSLSSLSSFFSPLFPFEPRNLQLKKMPVDLNRNFEFFNCESYSSCES